MDKTRPNHKTAYPLLGIAFALVGTGAFLLGMPLLWVALTLCANVFLAAGIVCGTEIKTVQRPNPISDLIEGEPETVDRVFFRIPAIPVVLALIAALLCGLLCKSALMGLLALITWGGLGIPLALCVLYRTNFGLSMQTGLIAAVAYTALAGAIQVFITTPSHTFNYKYCFELLYNNLTGTVQAGLTELQALPVVTPEAWQQAFGDLTAAEVANRTINSLITVLPELFAVGVLALLCIVWWGMKEALKRNANVEIQHMGRLDGYVPSQTVAAVYLLFFFASIFTTPGSGLQIAFTNISAIASAVLAFGGFSMILYIINSRIRAKGLRVLAILGVGLACTSACGIPLLTLLGLFCTGRDLRNIFGGDHLQ